MNSIKAKNKKETPKTCVNDTEKASTVVHAEEEVEGNSSKRF